MCKLRAAVLLQVFEMFFREEPSCYLMARKQ